jgi:hypothetical protein
MTDDRKLPATVTGSAEPQPRVSLEFVSSNYFKPRPPQGQEEKVWLERLKRTLGTTSSDFVNATLAQIQNACRLPGGGISETGVNAVLAFIEGSEVKNEVEAALAIQMGCTHAVVMTLLNTLGSGVLASDRSLRFIDPMVRLMKVFDSRMGMFRRLKNGDSQTVRVEHVHSNEGRRARRRYPPSHDSRRSASVASNGFAPKTSRSAGGETS